MEISSDDFKKMLKTGQISIGKKGKLKQGKLSNEYKKVLKDDNVLILYENKKIKNTKKCVVDGIKFDSNIEKKFYFYLKLLKIPFVFKKTFLLQEKFKLNNKTIFQITWTPDFYFEDKNIIIDTKGFATDTANIKKKLFMYKYRMEVYFIKNEKEFNIINKLKLI